MHRENHCSHDWKPSIGGLNLFNTHWSFLTGLNFFQFSDPPSTSFETTVPRPIHSQGLHIWKENGITFLYQMLIHLPGSTPLHWHVSWMGIWVSSSKSAFRKKMPYMSLLSFKNHLRWYVFQGKTPFWILQRIKLAHYFINWSRYRIGWKHVLIQLSVTVRLSQNLDFQNCFSIIIYLKVFLKLLQQFLKFEFHLCIFYGICD